MGWDWNNAPNVAEPKPGYYKTRLVKYGAYVTARIWEENGELLGEINGDKQEVHSVWEKVYSREITKDEFEELNEFNKHMRKNYPKSPEANPDIPFDLLDAGTPKFRGDK